MEFYITDRDTHRRVMTLLNLSGIQGENTREVMERIFLDMLRVEKATFYSQGRRGGGSWKALKPDTIRKKGIGGNNILRTDLAKPGYSMIGGKQTSDVLFKSLTKLGSEYQIFRITNNNIIFGTSRPFAGAHQHGSWIRNIPARPFMRWLPSDTARWHRIIQDHLMEPYRAKT